MDNNFEIFFKEALRKGHDHRENMQKLPIEVVKKIYFKHYWNGLRLSEIKSELLQEKLFDAGINVGIKPAAKLLQECINDLLGEGSELLVVDGRIGIRTIRTVNELFSSDQIFEDKLISSINGRINKNG